MSRLVNNWQFVRNKVICLILAIGLFFSISGCRSFSSKSPKLPLSQEPVPTGSAPVSTPPITTPPITTQPVAKQPIPEKSTPPQSSPIRITSYRPPTFLELENQSKSIPESFPEKTMMFRSSVPEHFIVKKEVLPSQSKPIPVGSEQLVSEQPVSEQPVSKQLVSENTTVNIPTNNIPTNTSTDVDVLNRRIAELEKALAESENQSEQEKQPTIVSKPIVSKPIVPQVQSPRWVPTINHSGVTVSSDGERIRIAVIDQVLFQSGTWRLNPDAEELLRKIVGEIRANNPNALLEIEGHTDGVMNTDPANATQKHDISSAKTMVIMDYFVRSLRWNATKIKTSHFGSSCPVADNNTPEGRIQNNRIEIAVSPM
ncbi:MAG: OmpA family protein [Planctomycetaceae bacterium]|jgi:flagellar motor protein MotB|nr:OmpA family protein [Planctomycetaceae bacterium]